MSNVFENMVPLVSVVITTFNRKQNLKQAINSILEQTFKNFEIIIVDNFSQYEINNFVRSFNDSRIKLIQNDNNGNYVINRNLGIKHSKGEFIAFCDDDDYWLPHKLESQLKLFEKKKEVGLVYSKCYMLKNDKIYRTAPKMKLYNGKVFYKMIFIPSVPILTAMIKREVIDKIGYFIEDKRIMAQEDNEFWIRLSKYYNVVSVEEPTAVYREHIDNLSNTIDITLTARFRLHKHMLEMKTISFFEWVFFALPAALFVTYARKIIFVYRRFTQ